ncbi:hypothetical protein BVY01_02975 [bacterium I07]|nr:hypothetical protein BVY01_02975 [bacterium I07]
MGTDNTGSVTVGKFNLRYKIEGEGIPTIVIGFPNYYSRVFSNNLRSHLRFVFMDHRGSAPSPGSVEVTEFSLNKLVDDIEIVRHRLKLGKVAIIGHSGHAFMALEYAKRYPSSVSHVIMIGIAPDLGPENTKAAEENWQKHASPERKSVLEVNQRQLTNEQLKKMPPSERFIRSYVRNGPTAWFDPKFDSSPLWEGVAANMDMIDYVWGVVFRDIDITKGLDTFNRPVFLALGRYDFLVAPHSTWDQIKGKFRDLTIRIFEQSGHTPPYEEPDRFDAEFLRWMSEMKTN